VDSEFLKSRKLEIEIRRALKSLWRDK